MTGRLDEMSRLAPQLGSVSGSYWEGRADRYDANARSVEDVHEPFLRTLRQATRPEDTAIDAGAGTGRFALPLAAEIAQVTAVDPSPAMLAVLEREARRAGTANVSTVCASWEEAEVDEADVAFSAFVLPLVADAPAFVRKLQGAARRQVLLYLGAYAGDSVLDPLWRHFHGAPRAPGAGYLDALAVLEELGIEPAVKVVEVPIRKRFATVEDAVEHYREGLLLEDTGEVRRELEGLLRNWLLGRRGAFRSPLRSMPAAILAWDPRRP